MKTEETLILSIETATRAGSLALLGGRELLAALEGDATRSHSTDLLDLIQRALDEAGRQVRDVDLFAVALGPGSFTGLRIGVATAKGLASTLGRKVAGVPTLQAVALAACFPERSAEQVVALLPAGRGELFAQSFRVEDSSTVRPLDKPAHVAPVALLEKFRGVRKVLWAGEGALTQRERLQALAESEGISFVEEKSEGERAEVEGWTLAALPKNLATYVGLLAFEKQGRGEVSAPEELQAIYVRPSDAELKEQCRT